MTDYNTWDTKARHLVEEAEQDDEEAKKVSDEICGLQDGPQGPPTQKARERRKEMGEHSKQRGAFIAKQKEQEMTLTHTGATEPIVITKEELGGRALRIQGSEKCTYEVPEGVHLLKIFLDRCRNVKVYLKHPLKTSSAEICHCSDVEFTASCSVATFQVDECVDDSVRVIFSEPEYVGTFFHQNSPALQVMIDGADPMSFGAAGEQQLCSRPKEDPLAGFNTEPVLRGEGDFPVNLDSSQTVEEPETERQLRAEQLRVQGEAKRQQGNQAFKANDFLQAAVFYTEAIRLCPDVHLAWSNRAQCFLQTAQPEKALEDATRCAELEPTYAKGWFRKGMALHSLKRYSLAILAFAEAEKLDPKSKQIPDAIKMAQLMCRKHGPGDDQ